MIAHRAMGTWMGAVLLLSVCVLGSCAEAWKLYNMNLGLRGTHVIPLRSPKVGVSKYDYEVRWYEQTLDHFSSKNNTFQQKYMFAPQFWEGAANNAPIFMYCGNEGVIEWFAENSGFLWEIASKFGALLVFPEHRYYGESMPFGSWEAAYKDSESLAYLNSQQALADFVTLITDLKRNLSADGSPVVVFGGSYGGMLAAWLRLKYPHVAIGAVASSAPILQFEDIIPTDTYYDIVSNDFKRASKSCFDTIKNSWEELFNVGSTNEGLANLTKQFGLCKSLESISELSDWLSSAYSYLAMTNYPYAANFVMPLPSHPVAEVCKAMDSLPDGSDVLARVFAGASVFYNYTGEYQCFDLEDDPHGMNGWNWQSCTEMVMPMSSNPNTSMFYPWQWDLKVYEQMCIETYGVKPRSHWIAEEFGGKNIKAVLQHFGSNIVFANGLLDPWSGGSVLTTISPTIVALNTEEGAHHLDLRASTPKDPHWLKVQRSTEVAYIKRWLDEYSSSKGISTHQVI